MIAHHVSGGGCRAEYFQDLRSGGRRFRGAAEPARGTQTLAELQLCGRHVASDGGEPAGHRRH